MTAVAALSHSYRNERDELHLKRGSVYRVADAAAIHLDLALGCLQVADDAGLEHHMRLVVNHIKASAKLTNDLIASKNGGAG